MKFEKGTWTQWQPATRKPDADSTVLVFSPKADEPCWLGYWDGEVWRDVLGTPYATRVEMWAELPYPVEAPCSGAVSAPSWTRSQTEAAIPIRPAASANRLPSNCRKMPPREF